MDQRTKLQYEIALMPDSVINDCLQYIDSYRLSRPIIENSISTDSADTIVKYIDFIEKIKCEDIMSGIYLMQLEARDRSKGACPLDLVFLSPKTYNETVRSFDIPEDVKSFKISNIRILKDNKNVIRNDELLGFCKSKYKVISPELIIILANVV